jgi:hypothetical protein
VVDEAWPALDYPADRPVIEAMHAYLQLIGKLPTRGLPWTNHGWHAALRVVPRGFRTYPVPLTHGEGELLLDCLDGCIRLETSQGLIESVDVRHRPVSDVYLRLSTLLEEVGCPVQIAGAPNEIDPAISFADDHRDRDWDAGTARRIHRAFSAANRVFELFRSGFVGKASPSHLFWGSFDLAVTRFSGREAPLHPGGIPNLPDRVTREAYSHEVASAGFWLGGNGVEEAAFYAYGYPSPPDLPHAPVLPGAAYWHDRLGEFILPYAAVRGAHDPDATLLAFLQSGYETVAVGSAWDRAALEVPQGRFGRPYDVMTWRRL